MVSKRLNKLLWRAKKKNRIVSAAKVASRPCDGVCHLSWGTVTQAEDKRTTTHPSWTNLQVVLLSNRTGIFFTGKEKVKFSTQKGWSLWWQIKLVAAGICHICLYCTFQVLTTLIYYSSSRLLHRHTLYGFFYLLSRIPIVFCAYVKYV